MTNLLRAPHQFIRRRLTQVERLFVAAGLAGLVYGLLTNLPVLPPFWDGVVVFAIFAGTLYSPAIGYFLAIFAAVYPLYSISVYLAVLFIAITLLGQAIFVRNLGATVLVAAVPLLGGFHLAWIVPLLGGLWWGAGGGAWVGLLGAFWGMLAAGMAGLLPDWLLLSGTTPEIAAIGARFAPADSLETLVQLIAPFSPDTTTLLYSLLQMGAWSFVGGLVGTLVARENIQRRRPWGPVAAAFLGAVSLPILHLALAAWLQQHPPETLEPLQAVLFPAWALSFGVIVVLELLRDFFEHPLPIRRRQKSKRNPAAETSSGPTPVPMPTDLPPLEDNDETEDLIMLELD